VAVDVVQSAVDQDQLYRMARRSQWQLQEKKLRVLADAGYSSGRQFKRCQGNIHVRSAAGYSTGISAAQILCKVPAEPFLEISLVWGVLLPGGVILNGLHERCHFILTECTAKGHRFLTNRFSAMYGQRGT
jgi:hypothetical protein